MDKQKKIIIAILVAVAVIFSVVVSVNEARGKNRRIARSYLIHNVRTAKTLEDKRIALDRSREVMLKNRPLLGIRVSLGTARADYCSSVNSYIDTLIEYAYGLYGEVFDAIDEAEAAGCNTDSPIPMGGCPTSISSDYCA